MKCWSSRTSCDSRPDLSPQWTFSCTQCQHDEPVVVVIAETSDRREQRRQACRRRRRGFHVSCRSSATWVRAIVGWQRGGVERAMRLRRSVGRWSGGPRRAPACTHAAAVSAVDRCAGRSRGAPVAAQLIVGWRSTSALIVTEGGPHCQLSIDLPRSFASTTQSLDEPTFSRYNRRPHRAARQAACRWMLTK